MEDKRAHERITNLEAAIAENTKLTKQIAENTTELVMLVKGAKGVRSFVVWITPLVGAGLIMWGAVVALLAWVPWLLDWLKHRG